MSWGIRMEKQKKHKTKLGLEIPEGWSVVKLCDLFSERKTISSNIGKFPLYSFTIEGGVCPKTERYNREHLLKNKSENLYRIIHKDDFIFNPMNLRFGAIDRSNIEFPVSVSAYYNVLILNEKLYGPFLQAYLKSYSLLNVYDRISIGSLEEKKRVHLSMFLGIELPLPPKGISVKIGKILSTWDKAIEQTFKLIELSKLRKKGLMQQLLTGKKRLKGFDSDWKTKILKEVLTQAGKPFTPIKDKLYQEIGIRSHTKGIFYKEKVTGASLGNKRVFEIEPNCFVVNIVFAWEHAVAKTTNNELGMIASHRFPMYKPKKDILDLDYLLFFFKSTYGKHLLGLASPGGAGRNKTLGKAEFMKLHIPVPPIEEQKAIAKVLLTADIEIDAQEIYLAKLQEQKKGLMQQLLTGQKRVKID